MKTITLIGSPRKGGNTEILVDSFLSGFSNPEQENEKVYLYKYDISPCVACDKCKTSDFLCPVNDDMQTLYPRLDEADILVIGTPNYWFGPSAKTKLFIDRLRPYTSSKKMTGKKAVLIVAAADGPDACGPMVDMFRLSFKYLGVEFSGSVLGTAYEKRAILNDNAALTKAFEIGKTLRDVAPY